jgi:antitoxin component of MazEF toxin-antitoxin module
MNRKQKDQNKRKLTEVGKGSLGLTLPAQYISKLKWKKYQLVNVRLKRRSIIIRDWHPQKTKKKQSI